MTASSVEFFPCRVQLMGLPRSTTTSLATANLTNRFENSARPSIAKVRGISRNLFGTPDPVEMKNLYQQEEERLRSYVFERYNFDTKTLKDVNDEENERRQKVSSRSCTKQASPTCNKQSTQLPTLVEQELREHEQRLLNEEHRLNFASTETTPPSTEEISDHAKNSSPVTHRCCELHPSRLSTVVRPKPYTRQSLLTESFNMRKNRVTLSKNSNGLNLEELKTLDNHNSHRKVKISDSLNCQQKTIDVKNKLNDRKIDDDQKTDGVNKNKSTNMSDKNNCTKVSLQVVLSTENAS